MPRGQPSPTSEDYARGSSPLRPTVVCSALVFSVTSPDGVADSEVTLCPDTHYVPVLLCSSGMPWDFKSRLGVIFFSVHTQVYSLLILFFIFPSLNQFRPRDFSFSEMGLPHILRLCLSTSFSSSLGLAFGSSMSKMPFSLHSCNSAALALWTDRLRESCKSQVANLMTSIKN